MASTKKFARTATNANAGGWAEDQNRPSAGRCDWAKTSAAVEHSTRRVGEDVDGTLRPVSALSSTTQTKAMWIRLAAEV